MLSFSVIENGQPGNDWPLRNAYLIGSDRNPMRGEIKFQAGAIVCIKREAGSAALALQKPVGRCGEMTIQTCLLPERSTPYLLNLELARHQLMRLYNKLEDWGLFDLDPTHAVMKRVDVARDKFIDALSRQNNDRTGSERSAHESLVAAIDGCEELALAHAELLLNKRNSSGNMPESPVGCGVGMELEGDRLRAGLAANFDFLYLPVSWRHLAPEEGEYRWSAMDQWIEWIGRERVPAIVGPIISFEPMMVPDWLYIWERQFDTVRDLIYEHVERVVARYASTVTTWNVVSGLHVNSHFPFTFDQIMDLTGMVNTLVKKTQATAKTLIEIRQPFGEYYGANQRSIPPMTYADLLTQGAISFDGFSVKLFMGQAVPGQYTRDLMQVSCLLDQFASLGKPLTLTIAAPSKSVSQLMTAAAGNDEPVDPNCGFWRKPWSPLVQSHWLEAVLKIALSKPFVESVAWHDLIDHRDSELPLGGLVGQDQHPKGALRRLIVFRKSLNQNGQLHA